MKAFLVGDNRTNLNWGRGASIALRQLLSPAFEITGCVTGDYFNLSTAEVGYVGTLMPASHYSLFRHLWRRRSRQPFSAYLWLEQLLGARDFIDEDPSMSIDLLLAYKESHAPLKRLYDQAMESDCFVVDGDGDIIFSTPPRRQTLFLLAMIELAIRLEKPVFLVNSMISDCPLTGRNVSTLASAAHLFAQCRAVFLRDPESLEYVRAEMPEVHASQVPDSLFYWYPRFQPEASAPPRDGDFLLPHPEKEEYWGKLDFSHPYVCIGGGALSAWESDKAAECYGRLIDAVSQLGYRIYLTENDSPDSFLQRVAAEKHLGLVPVDAPILMCGAVLSHARLFISGRYHPSILASLGGTPCIFLGSNAHKMGSLSRVLEYTEHVEFKAFPEDDDISGIMSLARKYLGEGEGLRNRIRRVAKLRCDEATNLATLLERHMKG